MKKKIHQRFLAWGVHIFTSLGLVAGFFALVETSRHNWREAAMWIVIGYIIDAIDGTFARLVDVKSVLPEINGSMIDEAIDFTNYKIVPAFFLFESSLVGDLKWIAIFIMLISSSLHVGKTMMENEDEAYLIGVPAIWHVLLIYLFFVLDLNIWVNFSIIILFSVLNFVPVKFIYPSQTRMFRPLTLAIIMMCIISNSLIIYAYPQKIKIVDILSCLGISYFLITSLFLTFVQRKVN
jgi:phosphatidylcholine synthase